MQGRRRLKRCKVAQPTACRRSTAQHGIVRRITHNTSLVAIQRRRLVASCICVQLALTHSLLLCPVLFMLDRRRKRRRRTLEAAAAVVAGAAAGCLEASTFSQHCPICITSLTCLLLGCFSAPGATLDASAWCSSVLTSVWQTAVVDIRATEWVAFVVKLKASSPAACCP